MAVAPASSVVVTGLGMVSPIGRDAVTSAASARAGLTRLRPLDGPLIVDPDTGEPEQPLGHVVAGLTDGFWKLGRLVRLGAAALKDLHAQAPPVPGARTGLFVNLPSGFYQLEHERAEREAADEEPPPAHLPPMPFVAALRTNFYRERLGAALCAAADLDVPAADRHLFFGDQAGFVHLLVEAVASLHAGRYTQCLVGGIDAYVESDCIEALDALGLLKTATRPAGFFPGEAAAFIRLELADAARRRGGGVEAVLEAPATGQEPFHRLSGQPAVGMALSRTIAATLGQLPDGGGETGLLIGNLNGDPYRSYDWGCALVRLRVRHAWVDREAWFPALSIGEIGAATGPAAVCLAARAFARGYAGTDHVLVWLLSDTGDRGAFYLRRPTR